MSPTATSSSKAEGSKSANQSSKSSSSMPSLLPFTLVEDNLCSKSRGGEATAGVLAPRPAEVRCALFVIAAVNGAKASTGATAVPCQRATAPATTRASRPPPTTSVLEGVRVVIVVVLAVISHFELAQKCAVCRASNVCFLQILSAEWLNSKLSSMMDSWQLAPSTINARERA